VDGVLNPEPFSEIEALIAAVCILLLPLQRHLACPGAALQRLPEAEVCALGGVTENDRMAVFT
jgi:hypothetical protein